jgi:hypothetical protein
MPVKVVRRGDKFCVEEPNGKPVKCHAVKADADAHARAINANIHKSMIDIYKSDSGLRHVLLISSNAYEDRDEEIVMEKALVQHVKDFEPGGKLLFWHGGQAIGTVQDAWMSGPFLVEIAQELENKVIDIARQGEDPFLIQRAKVWDHIEAHKGDWGVSPGFVALRSDADDGVFEDIRIVERSILPRKYAANYFTYAAL